MRHFRWCANAPTQCHTLSHFPFCHHITKALNLHMLLGQKKKKERQRNTFHYIFNKTLIQTRNISKHIVIIFYSIRSALDAQHLSIWALERSHFACIIHSNNIKQILEHKQWNGLLPWNVLLLLLFFFSCSTYSNRNIFEFHWHVHNH